MTIYTIPRADAPIAGADAPTTQWYNYLRFLDTRTAGAAGDVQAEITVIATKLGSPDGTVDNIPTLGNVTSVQGFMSISSMGIGAVQLRLVNDAEVVAATSFYGTASTGAKGWQSFYGTLKPEIVAGDNITITADDIAKTLTISGSSGLVPYFVPTGVSYIVPVNLQALFTIPITLQGTAMLIINGMLAEVH